jgi:hypothetical protein
MTIALRDAPGVSSGFNWITDIGGPVDPNDLNSVQLAVSPDPQLGPPYGTPLFWFGLNTVYAYDPNSTLSPNTFNQMGLMGGPLKNADGTLNVGGPVALTLVQTYFIGGPSISQIPIAQTVVDMTSWVPGEFYWSPELPNPVSIWGSMLVYAYGSPANVFYTYTVYATCTVPYSVYAPRPCTLLNGNTWGSQPQGSYGVPYPNTDHLCFGTVDFTSFNPKDLGTASLAPSVGLSGQPIRQGGLHSNLVPQIGMSGQLRRKNVFEGVNNMTGGNFVLSASMSGGPLWKPAKLCTG